MSVFNVPFSEVNLAVSRVLYRTLTARSRASSRVGGSSLYSCFNKEMAAYTYREREAWLIEWICDRNIYLVVVAYTCSLPSTIVTTRITLIELKTIVWVPTHVENGYTEWTLAWRERERHLFTITRLLYHSLLSVNVTSKLCVCLFDITESHH